MIYDNFLKKGGNKELSDEEVEETLEKLIELLAHINDKGLYAQSFVGKNRPEYCYSTMIPIRIMSGVS